MEADVLESGQIPFRVAEADIVEAHVADDFSVGQFPAAPAGLNRLVDDFENALAGRASGLHQLIELMQFADWFVKKTGQDEKRCQVAELHRAGEDRARTDPNHRHYAERAD